MRPFRQEEVLINKLDSIKPKRLICSSLGVGQLPRAAAKQFPNSEIVCHFIDLYRKDEALNFEASPQNLSFICSPDLPDEQFSHAIFPFSKTGDAELTREILQEAFLRLEMNGVLIISTDNPSDTWLKKEVDAIFGSSKREVEEGCAVYIATKNNHLKRERDFSSKFAFKDKGKLIWAFSRPGVFSHRSIDAGARKLLNAMNVEDGFKILDIGCGSGTVALGAALRAKNVDVLAVDSNSRAVQSTAMGANLNGLSSIKTLLNYDGQYPDPETFDLALANPPYYSDFKIAELFMSAASRSLKKGGVIIAVTKMPKWYEKNMPHWFNGLEIWRDKDYFLVRGTKK